MDKKSCLVMPQFDLNTALKYGALSANIVSEEPIDMVLHESYDGNKTLWDEWQLEKFVPFNPTDKYTIAVVKNKQTGEMKRIMKGAPQVRARTSPFFCASHLRSTLCPPVVDLPLTVLLWPQTLLPFASQGSRRSS